MLCHTGVFTAPVRGLYYFRFTACDHNVPQAMRVMLFHSGRSVLSNNVMKDNTNDYVSNALTLELAEGDEVFMALYKGYGIFDSPNRHSTFTGFLLFPM